ncbi:MAG: complex I NDUFA9 subunit family protein [Verrucomicrobiota bacterium]
MNVFLTGATGFVGAEMVRQLRAAGHSVRALVRSMQSPSSEHLVSSHCVELYRGNILEAGSLTGSLDGMDAVIHLVGIISEVGENTFENVHTLGTKNMVDAANHAGVKRFMQMSALGVRADAVARYHRSKWAAEELVRSSGLDFTIFRPSIIYGSEDHFVNFFARLSRWSPVLPVMGSGQGTLQPICIGDVAHFFLNSLNDPRAFGQTYDLCGPDILTMPAILKTICDVTGRKRWQIRVPLTLARMQAALLEFIFPTLLRKASPLTRDQLIMLEERTIGNGIPANLLFGIAPPHFREGIAVYLK